MGWLLPAMASAFAPPDSGVTILLPGEVPMSFTYVSPGEFRMGSPQSDSLRDGDEAPAVLTRIESGFYLGTYEVTQAQWQAVMGENPAIFQQTSHHLQHPVESVSWQDCQDFVARLEALGLGQFRLPTEAEWEYACRAGTTTRFYWGDTPNWEAHQYGWMNSRSHAATNPVGQKIPNAFGFYDMSGNVWEWCQDTYIPYGKAPRTDTLKVFRGGSWYDFPVHQRSANRHRHGLHERYTAIGVRLVWEGE